MDQPQGNGAPQAPEGTSSPEAAAPQINIDEKINKAITNRFKAFEKQFETKIGEGFGQFSKTLEEKLAALTPKPAEDPATAAKVASVEDHPSYKGLQKRMRELEAKAEQAEQARAAEIAKGRDTKLRQRLQDELAKNGVDAGRLRHAVGFLADVEKRVQWGDDDSISFKDEDSEVDLSTGVRNWLKSDDGKLYMPPRGVSGSGDRPVHGQTKQQGSLSDADIGMMILNHSGQLPIL